MSKKLFRTIVIATFLATTFFIVIASPTSGAVAASTLSMRGADVSSLQRAEDLGQKFFNASGGQQDPLDILKGIGVNYIRLRIWNNPASGYNNEAKVLAFSNLSSPGLNIDETPKL